MDAVPNPSIVALLNEAKQNNGKLVSIVESLDNEFLAQGLAYKLQIPCNMMGTHPCNRDGYGLHDSAVHSLGSEICAVGFSWGATSHACCIEDNASRDIENFSIHLCNSSDLLADSQPGDIKFGSLSCSHTCFLEGSHERSAVLTFYKDEGQRLSEQQFVDGSKRSIAEMVVS